MAAACGNESSCAGFWRAVTHSPFERDVNSLESIGAKVKCACEEEKGQASRQSEASFPRFLFVFLLRSRRERDLKSKS
jgi:hypothetical protein